MLRFLRKLIPERSAIRQVYHKWSAVLAALWYRFPGHRLSIIAVTGTSGKSTTVELIHYLLQESGVSSGAISGIFFSLGNEKIHNPTLRTTLRPWHTQKLLRQMVSKGCQFAVIEVSSHAIDQNRLWGTVFDTVVLTNIQDGEHLDYHENFADYVRTKLKIFKELNASYRKPNVPKIMILNQDDENTEFLSETPADHKWTYSLYRSADILISDLNLSGKGTRLKVRMPNHQLNINTSIVGAHNISNMLAAVAVVAANGVPINKIEKLLKDFPGIPGRLEPVNNGQDFSVIVDFSYKPSGLRAVLSTLRDIVPGKLICIWGGLGGRNLNEPYYQDCAQSIEPLVDHFILTTDDPLDDDPKAIANLVKKHLKKNQEGDKFFEIEDRYEAIRYGIFVANPGDCVLIAGRGHEAVQTISDQKIPFDDRVIVREILEFVPEK